MQTTIHRAIPIVREIVRTLDVAANVRDGGEFVAAERIEAAAVVVRKAYAYSEAPCDIYLFGILAVLNPLSDALRRLDGSANNPPRRGKEE